MAMVTDTVGSGGSRKRRSIFGRGRGRSAAAVMSLACVALAASSVHAAVATVNFETSPALSTGPSVYVAVPGPQTFITPPATFSGGVVLGFATFFPAISFASAPNVYGTANFGNGLPEALTISVNPAFTTTEISFALFNGETFNQSYSVDAFNGTTVVGNQTLSNMAPNFNSGFGIVDLVVPGGITKVVITPVGAPSVWDFLIDTVVFNQSLNGIVLPPITPPPPAPPVQGHRHGHKHGETELVEVDFGDYVNDIRGSVLLVQNTPTVPNTPSVPEPATVGGLVLVGVSLLLRRR